MSRRSARQRAILWFRQGEEDLKAAEVLLRSGQHSQACFLAQQAGEKSVKALLADADQDLRSHSLSALLRELGGDELEHWSTEARALDKLYAPTRTPDALGDAAPMDVFGPEDASAAIAAAKRLLQWCGSRLT